jgi:nickel-dependent lactate racemase
MVSNVQVRLPELLWYEKTTFDIELPADWDVAVCPMRGARAPALTLEQMADAICTPVGKPRLRELARGKRRACILFDGMTRPTRIDQLGSIVIRELLEAGIDQDNITFVCALGSHGALSQVELREKCRAQCIDGLLRDMKTA